MDEVARSPPSPAVMHSPGHRPIIFTGFDIETTGSNPNVHQVIQVGVDGGGPETFISDIGYRAGTWREDPEAMKVNRFTTARIIAGPPITEVDRSLAGFLNRLAPGQRCVPVGWNVGSFDVVFIRDKMPQSAFKFGYQSVDLNAVCFTLAMSRGVSFWEIKDHVKSTAERVLAERGIAPFHHDALYDAREALAAWEELRRMIGPGVV